VRPALPARTAAPLGLAVALLAWPSSAQETVPVPLAPGFTPDPLTVVGVAQGRASLRSLGAPCDGWTTEAPLRRFAIDEAFVFLRFATDDARRLLLAVQDPEGGWRCGRQVATESHVEGRFEAGVHQVWVARTGELEGPPVPFSVAITEMRSVVARVRDREARPTVTGADLGLDVRAATGRFDGDLTLRRGFLPDPQDLEGEASGTVDVRRLGTGCEGFVERAPNHVLTVGRGGQACLGFDDPSGDELDYFRLQVLGGEDLVMVLRNADGTYECSAPPLGGTPRIVADDWPVGCYLIWIGVRTAGARVPYRLRHTEVRP
jgi:hypothetical protein